MGNPPGCLPGGVFAIRNPFLPQKPVGIDSNAAIYSTLFISRTRIFQNRTSRGAVSSPTSCTCNPNRPRSSIASNTLDAATPFSHIRITGPSATTRR